MKTIIELKNLILKEVYNVQKQSYNDILSVKEIRQNLRGNEFSNNLHIYNTLESTNNTSKMYALNGFPHGTVVIANNQTKGRGRYGREFFSPAGSGIYMSFILRPEFLEADILNLITVFTAVCVQRAIMNVTGIVTSFKWVNDIFLSNKKISGILTEKVDDVENNTYFIILGIGINVYMPRNGFPDELKPITGYLYKNCTQPGLRNRLIAEIINEILYHDTVNIEKIIEEYRRFSILINRKINVVTRRETYSAVAVNIDSSGHLIVKNNNNELITLSSGEVNIKLD